MLETRFDLSVMRRVGCRIRGKPYLSLLDLAEHEQALACSFTLHMHCEM